MSRLFSSIGSQITSFLDLTDSEETYKLDRQFTVNIKSDPVKWSIENKLTNKDGVESELRFATDITSQDTLSCICSTTNAPAFSIETKRLNKYFDVTAQYKSPLLKLGLIRNISSKYSFDVKSDYNQTNGKLSVDTGVCYNHSKDLTLGLRSKVAQDNKWSGLINYSLAAEYNPDASKMFYAALNGTQPNNFGDDEEKANMGATVGVGVQRDIGTLYGQVNYNILDGSIEAGVGINRDLKDNSDISVVARLNRTVDVMYTNEIEKMNATVKAGARIEMDNQNKPKATMQWKLTFGDSFTKDDFGALGDKGVSL